MGNQREYPVIFSPKGLSDAWEASATFPGACRALTNLIFDQTHSGNLTCRPGVTLNYNFSDFTTPTGVPVYIALGDVVYGMVSSADIANQDVPFAYNVATNTLIAITGAVLGNTPVTQSTSGDWTPPTMGVIGTKIIVTHPGFSGTGTNFFGVIDITTPSAPTWVSTNTATNALPGVPTCVANFNNRAYFGYKNQVWYSDVLEPTTMTNAGQSLTVGDTTAVTALSGLPVQTTSAGVVAALLAFKARQVWQITGDDAIAGTLAQNYISLNCGCVSPRTIVQTPTGTIFIATDGPYYVSPFGQLAPLTKSFQTLVPDLQLPFQNIANPSRAAAAYSGSIYRVCLQTVISGSAITGDYWFDITERRWSGPHSFPYDCAVPVGNHFVISALANGAKLYKSESVASLSSVYTDDGVTLSVRLLSCLLPYTQNINVKQVVESTIELSSLAASTTFSITALDEAFNQIDGGTTAITVVSANSTYDSGATYDSGLTYSSGDAPPIKYTAAWTQPLVFNKFAWQIIAQSGQQMTVGNAFLKYRDCGYTNLRGQIA